MSDQSGEPIGSVLGNYRIERLLGRGGFASVYLAEDVRPQLKRKVALKVLNPALAADGTFRERFLRESALAVGLDDHPSIVPVYDASEVDGKLYIAMRFIDGIDLKQAIDTEGQLDPGYVASVTSQIAGALDVAHAAGLVHRDVKPANVLLSKNGQRAYLADFGLTKRLNADQALTQTPGYMGTTFYSPPEQFEGTNVTSAADIYALGAVIFHCLTGEPPFPGTPESVIGAHLTKPVPLVTSSRPELPPDVNDVITRAMAKDPRDRQQSAGLLAAELSRAVVPGDRTTGATTPPAPFPISDAGATAIGQAPSNPGGPASFGPPSAGPVSAGPSSAGPASAGPVSTGAPSGPTSTPPPPGTPSTPPGSTGPPPPPGSDSSPPGYGEPPGQGPASTPPGWSSSPGPGGGSAKKRRTPLLIGAGAVVVVALVVIAVVALSGGGGSSGSGPTTDAKPTQPAAYPSKAEQSLLAVVPRDRQSQCKRSTAAFGNAEATVQCNFTSEQADELTLVSYSSSSELTKQYKQVLSDNASNLGTNSDCRWVDNESNPYKARDGNGDVSCYFARGNSYLVWTNTTKRQLGVASKKGNDSLALYNWWADLVHRTDKPVALRSPSPGEKALLQSLPSEFRDSCRHNEDQNSDATGITASVSCSPAAADAPDSSKVDSVVYYSFRDTQTMNENYVALLTQAGAPAGTSCPGEITYTVDDQSAGRRFCALANGKAQVVWSRDAVNTVGVATATDNDFNQLVDVWWTNDGYYNT